MNKRRKHIRFSKDYRVEYGPFLALFSQHTLKTATVKNVSGGGVLFGADEELSLGSKIILKMYITGWRRENGSYIQADDPASDVLIKAIAEIVRVEHDPDSGFYRTGARFVGMVH